MSTVPQITLLTPDKDIVPSHRIVTDDETTDAESDRKSDYFGRRDLRMTSTPDSDNKAAPKQPKDDKVKRGTYKHTYPIHTLTKPSVLAKEAPPENYSGFIRLAMLVLAASNIRLVIENHIKYGFLLSLPGSQVQLRDYIFFLITWLAVPISLAVSFWTERFMANVALRERKKLDAGAKTSSIGSSEVIAAYVHAVNATVLLVYTCIMVYYKISNPALGALSLFISTVLFMKLVSFALVNHDLRALHMMNQRVTEYAIVYPNNIRVKNLMYFWWAPTLCYQPSYPRNDKFRPSFFLKRIGEIVIATSMMYFLTEQYANPTLRNSVRAIDELEFFQVVERVLKLSTVSLVIWLLGFYALFHSFLNALSEVLLFGDRTFYLAWWNSGSLATYWRLWNRPMYLWFKRHVYLPCVNRGVRPATASFLVFFISAILHEVLVGIPTHAIMWYAFLGMMGQIPLIAITRPLERWRGKTSGAGNMIFWISFCLVGQPAAILLYYYQWTINSR